MSTFFDSRRLQIGLPELGGDGGVPNVGCMSWHPRFHQLALSLRGSGGGGGGSNTNGTAGGSGGPTYVVSVTGEVASDGGKTTDADKGEVLLRRSEGDCNVTCMNWDSTNRVLAVGWSDGLYLSRAFPPRPH